MEREVFYFRQNRENGGEKIVQNGPVEVDGCRGLRRLSV